VEEGRFSRATWQPGPLQCRVDAGGHQLLVDEPKSAGGTGAGPQPTDLLLASITSCLALAIAWSAKRRGLEPTAIEVDGQAEYDGPRFKRVVLTVRCAGLPEPDVRRVVRAAERVCYVSNTLRRPPEMVVILKS
jgi:putative redox protein